MPVRILQLLQVETPRKQKVENLLLCSILILTTTFLTSVEFEIPVAARQPATSEYPSGINSLLDFLQFCNNAQPIALPNLLFLELFIRIIQVLEWMPDSQLLSLRLHSPEALDCGILDNLCIGFQLVGPSEIDKH